MIRRHHHNPRRAFTLIELMVAMALTMFVMVILTQAFTTSMDTFRELKGIGDMERNMRTATTLLRSDLQADHFEGKRRLSDPGFWSEPTREGFFRIAAGSSIPEGNDSDGITSWQAVNHRLHFAVKRRGNRREHFMSASVPTGSPLISQQTNFFGFPADSRYGSGNYYTSQWAEVAYFLSRSGTTTDPLDPNNASGTPLYSLYRVQKLLISDTSNLNNQVAQSQSGSYSGFSWQPANGFLRFNSPTDVTNSTPNVDLRGFDVANPTTAGASLVLTNVVNFNVQGVPSNGLATDVNNYDTAPGSPALVIHGVQIILRVWDQKTEQARQVTIIQDL